jgi:thiopeptide-type bacteriocin biosynthesis protein
MNDQRCLYALLHAGREEHEALIRELVIPAAREIRGHPDLDSLFFARYNQPDWQLRFRILGRPAWVDGAVRDLLDTRLQALRKAGVVGSWEFASYDRETERYGGEEGMALAEEIFLHDSLFCLDYIEAETRGETTKSRREVALLYTDRVLDLFGFTREQRLAFYRHGYRWAVDMKTWEEEEFRVLDERYEAVKDGLADLLWGDQRGDPVAAWGGASPARAGEATLAALEPVVGRLLEAHRDGRVHQEIVYLSWSYTHMHCNRLGISPSGEAILRYFVNRLLLDETVSPA